MLSEDNAQEVEEKAPPWFEVLLAVAAGSFYGLGGVFLKKTMTLIETSTSQAFNPLVWGHWNILFTSLTFWATAILFLSGIVLWVWALHKGRVTIIGPIGGGFIVLIPVICGLFGVIIQEEPMFWKKAIGIITITIGSMGLARRR